MTTNRAQRKRQSAIHYVAHIDQVREVSLLGSADLGFWRGRLKHEGLTPIEENSRARVLISGTQAKYNGIRFRELCFLIAVTHEAGGSAVEGYFLAHAFNSVRLYAWIERTFFSCPYHKADVRVETEPQIALAMRDNGQTFFEATLARTTAPTKTSADGWQGPILVPTGRRAQFFYAQLSGETEVYPCSKTDRINILAHPRWPIFDCLRESGFIGHEWSIRRSAVHAKSQTLDRSRCTPELVESERAAGYLVK